MSQTSIFDGYVDYSLEYVFDPMSCFTGSDVLEPNDFCMSAISLVSGSYPSLNTRYRWDAPDGYALTVASMFTLTIDAFYFYVEGDVVLLLFGACHPNPTNFIGLDPLSYAATGNGEEQIVHSSDTPSERTVYSRVTTGLPEVHPCANYELVIDIRDSDIEPYCFGDGFETPCPFGNPSIPGHPGGCAHSAGNGGVLAVNGIPSASTSTLDFSVTSAFSSMVVLMVSGANPLPLTGACSGCGFPAFCRTDPTTGCQPGQNSANGVAVTYRP